MTYPPPGHYLRHLRISEAAHAPGEMIGRMECTPDLAGDDGCVRLGPIAAMVDVVGAAASYDYAAPDWAATLDLSLQLAGPVTGPLVVARPALLRSGGGTMVVDLPLTDGADAPVGRATVTYTRLPRRDDNPLARPTLPPDYPPVEADRPSLWGYLGLRERDGGVELDRIVPVHNSIGAVNGGALATLADEAALLTARRVFGGPARTTDCMIHYLAAGRTGPLHALATPQRHDASGLVLRVEITDTGDPRGARLVTLVTVNAQPVAG
ncbi:MAG: hotdog domain-containing protein [Acidimicrobiales bacterium]